MTTSDIITNPRKNGKIRTFISINIPEDIRKEIKILQNSLKDYLGVNEKNKVKWESPDKFHITVFFIGDVSEEKLKRIIQSLDEIPKTGDILFSGGEFNAFPNTKFPRVLFAGFNNPDNLAKTLYTYICSALEFEGIKPDKQFHPHITIGRVRKDEKISISKFEKKYSTEFSVDGFSLMKSVLLPKGSVYTEIKRFKL